VVRHIKWDGSEKVECGDGWANGERKKFPFSQFVSYTDINEIREKGSKGRKGGRKAEGETKSDIRIVCGAQSRAGVNMMAD